MEDKLHLGKTKDNFVCYEENSEYIGLDWFKDIFDAIANSRVLHITYSKFNGAESWEWDIHPYFLKQYNNRWFLLGLNDYNDTIYTIPLDRIEDIKELRKDFIPNTFIDIEEYYNDLIGVTKTNTPKENIRLKFTKERFPYIMTKAIHKSQRIIDINERIIEISVFTNKELESLILSFGSDVEVISPTHFREQIKEKIKASLNNY